MEVKMFKIVTFLWVFSITLFAKFSLSVTIPNPLLIQDKNIALWDSYNAQDLLKTYKTNYIVKLTDGNVKQYSSLRTLVSDYNSIKFRVKSILVVDVATEQFVDVKKVFFVINSKVKTKSSKISKLAFKRLEDAKKFQAKYQGDIKRFDFVFKLAKDNLESDKQYFAKIDKKDYKKGKKIYQKLCQKIDTSKYNSILELKYSIKSKKLCKKINNKKLQLITKYLWNKGNIISERNDIITVTKKDKCPVCGMFVYKYPKWAAKIKYKHNDHIHYLTFDGVKDMMKFYFSPLEWGDYKTSTMKNIQDIYVTDYYSQKRIEARKAYFVIGSDIYGPMGHELIPFRTYEEAINFKRDHYGKKVLRFDEITEDIVYDLD